MKKRKVAALFFCGALAVSMLAGCSQGQTGGDDKADAEDDKKAEAEADPSDPAGYYQYSYEVEGMGTWVNYIHLYEESSIGQVFYAGFASNQITVAGTYEITEAPCDYSVYMTREDQEGDKLTDGSADYTITFKGFDGADLGSCAYDGEYIYNDTTGVAGTGAENVAYQKDPEGMDSKYGQADSGYKGEVGVAYLSAVSPDDETCTVKLNHNGTYEDLMDVLVEGTWTMSDDGKTFTLTPDDEGDTAATLVLSDDGTTATYTPDGGTAVTLNVDTQKAVSYCFAAVIPAAENNTGADVDIKLNCYGDSTCEVIISAYGVDMPLDQGTYEVSAEGTATVHLDTAGDLTSEVIDNLPSIVVSYTGTPIGDINATLAFAMTE